MIFFNFAFIFIIYFYISTRHKVSCPNFLKDRFLSLFLLIFTIKMAEENLTLDEILKLADNTNEWEWYNEYDIKYFFCIPKERFKITVCRVPKNIKTYYVSCTLDNIYIGHYGEDYKYDWSSRREELIEGDGRIKDLYLKAENCYHEKEKALYGSRIGQAKEKAERERLEAVRKARELLR